MGTGFIASFWILGNILLGIMLLFFRNITVKLNKRILIVVISIAIVLIIFQSLSKQSSDGMSSQSKSVAGMKPGNLSPKLEWRIEEDTDPFTDVKTSYAVVTSKNGNEKVEISCTTSGVTFSDYLGNEQNITVTYRVDNQTPHVEEWLNLPSIKGVATLDDNFVASIRNGQDRLIIKADGYNTATASFSLVGARTILDQLHSRCSGKKD